MWTAGQGLLLTSLQLQIIVLISSQQDMALDSFGLFIHQSQATEGELQVKIYQILFDALMLYGVSFLEPKGYGVGDVPRPI